MCVRVRVSDTSTLCNQLVALSSMPNPALTHTHMKRAALSKGRRGEVTAVPEGFEV